jgi:cytochrome c oxidase subunit 2
MLRWKNSQSRSHSVLLIVVSGLALGLTSCGMENAPSALEPKGPGAQQIANIWWAMFVMAGVVYLAVIAFLIAVLVRRRQSDVQVDRTPGKGSRFVFLTGAALPAVILAVLLAVTLPAFVALAATAQNNRLVVEVVGRQYWWEVRYPNAGVVTANEIYIPAGQQVEFKLTSADVIHSLWVPELHGKMDLIPGQSNTHYIQADQPGEYRGFCAEFCGLQHAKMTFLVVAVAPAEFEEWLEHQRQPAPLPADDVTLRGQQIFLGSACIYCHAVRGTNAMSDLGPDLTHFASRRTIGAGILPNNRGNLAGWIIDSQSIKPGNKMPPMYIEGGDLQALLAYMETLK